MIPGGLRNYVFLFVLFFTSYCAKAQVTANFSATPQTGCAPLIVKFTNQSTGSPDSWKWDLGNGTVSYLENPSAVYFNPGKYVVKLVVKGINGEDSLTKANFIEVYAAPSVNFSVNATTGCFPLDVQFSDKSVTANGTINSWLWDFGDGGTSTLKNPVHTFTSDKNFNVTLLVKTTNGCSNVFTKNSVVQISAGALANFTNDNPQTCTSPVTINFQNLSAGTGSVDYIWDFGDGGASTLLNPSHTYTNIGTYTVKLVTVNEKGCRDTLIKPNAVTVGQVKADIKIPDILCQNVPAQFTNTSTPAPASVLWYFGDGSTSATLNPSKNYSAAGNVSVKMVANFGACTDSIIKTVSVLPKPSAAFTADKTSSCQTPFAVNFTAQGTGIATYSWNFGDGSVSTDATPSHTYSAAGSYTVKLIVANANGCTDTLLKSNYIVIKKPKITLTNIPDSNCAPFTKKFTATVNTVDPVIGYLWDFGDGNTDNIASPSHTYTTQGIYPVTLIITTASGCTDTAKIVRGIIVSNKPIVNFSATPLNNCAKDPIKFLDSSSAGVSKWLWKFGDNTSSTMKNPAHTYLDTGYFDVQLTVWNGGCSDSIKFIKYVHINAPVAKYIISSNCNKPYERVFTDQSIGADEWHWDFGDGTTSTTKSPVHTYATNGSYTVSLRVVNNASGCDFTSSKLIKIVNPVIDFASRDTAICKGATANFTTNLSLSDVSVFNWNFGDGSASSNSAANSNGKSYVYTKTGIFNVRLITTDVNGCIDTLIKPAFINVSGATAKFGVTAGGACLNSAITFSDSTVTDGIHPIKSWVWNYGDGTKDSILAPPFNHTYSQQGSYPVSLAVYNGNGCRDTFKLKTSLVISKPMADLSTIDTSSCPGKQIHFVSQSTGNSIIHSWDFGDNTTDNAINPDHDYSADGTYTVKLLVTDKYGCADSIVKQQYVKINTPVANFLISDSITNCPPLIVNFTNLSSNAVERKWDFGDSTYSTEINPTHFYNYAGNYTITLTVISSGGCISTFQKSVSIKGPQGSFIYPPVIGCNTVTVNFTATTNAQNKVLWDFNDGNIITNSTLAVSHTYNFAGSYIPKMILIDPTGCKVPIPGADTINVSGVKAHMNFINKLYCDSGIIAYRDSSIGINDAVTGFKWILGDGNISTLQNPDYQYTTAGTYYPKLVVTTSIGCTDSVTSSVPVKIVASPKINFAYTGNGCTPLTATFNAQILVPDTSAISWKWNFANGNNSTASNPSAQTYNNAGVYNVSLTGTNSSACKTTVTKAIESYPIPKVSIGPDTILCKGSSISLAATGASTYVWSPSTNLSCTNCAVPSTNTLSNITYYVTGTSTHGCVNKDTIKVTVKEKFVLTHSKADSVCKGNSKQMSASGAYTYAWTPSLSLDNASLNNPTATPDTSTTYRVIAVDDRGCFRDTAYIPIKVNQLPTVEAGVDKTINVGQTVDLIPQVSDDVIIAEWQPTSGVFRNFYPGVTVKPKENTEYSVEVKNRGGCKARDKVSVFVICNGANIFIPNTFSPNSDGINDIFYPRGTGLFKIKSLKIFDRWGAIVFDRSSFNANNPADGWDGKNKGKELVPDVFVYALEVICDNGSTLVYHGNVALIK